MKDRVKYKLKVARRPKDHTLLSGVAAIVDEEGKGYGYFSFSEEFVDAVGKALPEGLSPARPGYLKVQYIAQPVDEWRVFAMYFGEERGRLLWVSKERPAWVPVTRRD